MDFPALLELFLKTYLWLLAGLVLLIVVDVLAGVAAALRTKKFNWTKLGDFYYTMIVPMLLGWLAFSLLVFVLTNVTGFPPEIGQAVATGVNGVSYLTLVGTLVASIKANFDEMAQVPVG